MRNILANFALLVGSVVFTVVMAEISLRFLPVNEGLRAQAVNARQPVFHFEPNRVATYSMDWNFTNQNRNRVNNFGFVANHDYTPAQGTPLVAIVGDSYVEAKMVSFNETITGRLHNRAQPHGRIYAFAASGAGLPQYMVWAKFARETFKPDAFVFVIIGNDFFESLAARGSSPGFHRFQHKGANGWGMVRADYEPSLVRRTFRQSALAMYLVANLQAHARLQIPLWLGPNDKNVSYVGNVAAQTDDKVWKETLWATSVFLDNLPEWAGVNASRILFVIDGIRPQLYQPGGLEAVKDSFWARARANFMSQALKRKYEVRDMQPIFVERFSRTGKKFEFVNDSHWNGEGHAAAADAVASSQVWARVFERSSRRSRARPRK